MFHHTRLRLDLAFPEHWRVVKDMLDAALCWYYEEMADTETKVGRFLVRMQKELALLAGSSDIDGLIAANGLFTDQPHIVARVMKASLVGKAMFSSVWLACSREIFLGKVVAGMLDLERERTSCATGTNSSAR